MSKKLFISLTCIPSRIKMIEPVLKSLINQTVSPDMIYINIPKKYNRFDEIIEIPDFIYKKYNDKVKIYYTNIDYGPGTKFIGSLLNSSIKSTDIIAVTDDDIIKKQDWLEKLLNCYTPDKVCSFVEKNLGKQIIWGYLGYIFRKDLFDIVDILKFYNKIKDECFLVDDHWFTGYCHYRNITIYNIPINRNNVINKELLKGNDALVRIKGNNNRKNTSEKCRTAIYNKFNCLFPFWCCIGCCTRDLNYKKLKYKVIENFSKINSKKNYTYLVIILMIILLDNNLNTGIVIIILSYMIYIITKSYLHPQYKLEFFNISNNYIPKILIQTINDKSLIPQKVFDNKNKYASDYNYLIYDDSECRQFLKDNYTSDILDTFNILKGAHKADLFRYCFLYKHGGVYLDIKTELVIPLNQVITKNYTYTVLSIIKNTIYQGIIATKPGNPIFMELVNFIKYNCTNVKYIIYTQDFFKKICRECGKRTLKNGLNKNLNNPDYHYYLFSEICTKNPKYCKDGLDRYKLCCNVYDIDINKKVFKSRYADYPWK